MKIPEATFLFLVSLLFSTEGRKYFPLLNSLMLIQFKNLKERNEIWLINERSWMWQQHKDVITQVETKRERKQNTENGKEIPPNGKGEEGGQWGGNSTLGGWREDFFCPLTVQLQFFLLLCLSSNSYSSHPFYSTFSSIILSLVGQ